MIQCPDPGALFQDGAADVHAAHLAACERCALIAALADCRRLPHVPGPRADCDEALPAIAAFSEGVLDEPGKQRLADHLSTCADCRDTAMVVCLSPGLFDDVPAAALPDEAPVGEAGSTPAPASVPAVSVPAVSVPAVSAPVVSAPAPVTVLHVVPRPEEARTAAAAERRGKGERTAERRAGLLRGRRIVWLQIALAAALGAVVTAAGVHHIDGVAAAPEKAAPGAHAPPATAATACVAASAERAALEAERRRLEALRVQLDDEADRLRRARLELSARARGLPPPPPPKRP